MKWFRFYTEAMHDPKVQRLSPELFKFWVNLLCLASEREDRGTLPSEDEISFILRVKKPQCRSNLAALITLCLLDVGAMEGQCPGNGGAMEGQCPGNEGAMEGQC